MFFSGPGRKLAPATASLAASDSTLLVADSAGFVAAYSTRVPPEIPVHLRHLRPFAQQMVRHCRFLLAILCLVHLTASPASSSPPTGCLYL